VSRDSIARAKRARNRARNLRVTARTGTKIDRRASANSDIRTKTTRDLELKRDLRNDESARISELLVGPRSEHAGL
jgi:hypothetical protein